jgi:hypothetical protein
LIVLVDGLRRAEANSGGAARMATEESATAELHGQG